MKWYLTSNAAPMNDLRTVIYDYQPIYRYKDTGIDKSVIDQVIEAGCMAPSVMNTQPWKFYVVTDTGLINAMDEQICIVVADIYNTTAVTESLKKKNPIFYGAPVVIFIAAPRESEWAALDVGMCAENIVLSAQSAGVGSCPVVWGKYIERTSLYSQLNILPADYVVLAVAVGVADEVPVKEKRKKNTIYYIRSGLPLKHMP
jgi:nitroreductase